MCQLDVARELPGIVETISAVMWIALPDGPNTYVNSQVLIMRKWTSGFRRRHVKSNFFCDLGYGG
jgi:hypothetical protein